MNDRFPRIAEIQTGTRPARHGSCGGRLGIIPRACRLRSERKRASRGVVKFHEADFQNVRDFSASSINPQRVRRWSHFPQVARMLARSSAGLLATFQPPRCAKEFPHEIIARRNTRC